MTDNIIDMMFRDYLKYTGFCKACNDYVSEGSLCEDCYEEWMMLPNAGRSSREFILDFVYLKQVYLVKNFWEYRRHLLERYS